MTILKQIKMLTKLLLFVFVFNFCDCVVNINVNSRRAQSRVFGANVAEPNARPYQAALYVHWDENEIGFCGGALISRTAVLTAAHCVTSGEWGVNDDPGDGNDDEDMVLADGDVGEMTMQARSLTAPYVDIILGAYSLYDRYESDRRVYAGAEIIVHPGYNSQTYDNDLAIVTITRNVDITDSIATIGLPWLNNTGFSYTGRAAVVSGWGIPAAGVPYISPMLREKSLTVMSDSLCNSFYYNLLPGNIVCAYEASSGTCKGDNGSPLTITRATSDDETEDFLVGIASFVHSSGCNSEFPSVFTRIQNYLDWIQENTDILLL